MKNISFWARSNRKRAIALIIVIKISLALSAIFIAVSLNNMNVVLPANGICIAGILGFFVIASIYPSRKKGGIKTCGSYGKQKTCDFFLGLLSFLSITAMVNNADAPSFGKSAFGMAFVSYPTTRSASEKNLMSIHKGINKPLNRAEKRVLRRAFFRQWKQFPHSKFRNPQKSGVSVLLFLLAIIGAVGLLYLLAILVCNIYCSGSEALAIMVGVIGTAAIIGGLFLVINRILRPKQDVAKSIKEV